MKVFDFLNYYKQFSYNVELAKLYGIKESIYLSSLMSISTISDSGQLYVPLGKEVSNTIYNVTGLSDSEQNECFNFFFSAGIIIESENQYVINLNQFIGLSCSSEEVHQSVLRLKEGTQSTKKKKTKQDATRSRLMQSLKCIIPEVRDAYSDWIDSVIAKDGWMSQTAVEHGEQILDMICVGNKQNYLEILQIAAIHGWREIDWAVQEYAKKRQTIQPVKIQTNQYLDMNKFSSEVY